jgi:Surface-adhesin protein E
MALPTRCPHRLPVARFFVVDSAAALSGRAAANSPPRRDDVTAGAEARNTKKSLFSPLRGIALVTACIALVGGCAHRAPLDQLTQMPIERLQPSDRLQRDKVAYGALADSQNVPPDGTFETIYKVMTPNASAAGASAARSHCGWFCEGVGGTAYILLIVPLVIVASPFAIAHELLKTPETASGGSAGTTIDASAQAKEEARLASLKENTEWLATVALEEQFLAAWDDAYISALSQGLGRNPPLVKSSAERQKLQQGGKARSATAGNYFGAGISRMVLVGSKSGEQTLIICARSYLQSDKARARDFETCQSGPINLADRQDSHQLLQAVLVEKGRQLASLHAKALRGQARIVSTYASVAGNDPFPNVGSVDESDFSPLGKLFVDLDSIESNGKTDFAASLVVNFEVVSDTGVRSHVADIVVACATGAVTLSERRSYPEWYGVGDLIKAEPITRGIPPGPALDAAVQMICDAGPKLR